MNQIGAAPSIAEKLALLGYLADARLLIVNGDDLGMCHAANAATFESMQRGIMTAASLMMPCPWAYAACAYLREHPDLDVGVHLTLTSEWDLYRWGPLLGAARCPSLVDERGHLYPTEEQVWARAAMDEVAAEAEAQIERALSWGITPTNLDGHMSTFYEEPRFLAVYATLARHYRLPLRMAPRRAYAERGAAHVYDDLPLDGLLTNDDLRFVELSDPPALEAQLLQTLRTLQPGVTELCLHASLSTPEAHASMRDCPARVEALRLMTSDVIRQEIERQGIVRIGWRALRDAQRQM